MTSEQLNQALQVLVNAITIAQKRGTYTLQESAAIYAAIQSFNEMQSNTTDNGAVETNEVEET